MSDNEAAKIATGSVFDPPDAPYFRFFVARTWPPGIERGAVDQWDRELAPSTELVSAWRLGEIDDAAFESRYEAELDANPSMLGWAVRTASLNGITLVDDFDSEPAPRTVLAAILARRIAEHQ
ncbi:MAG: hypothetical protein HOH95_04605, partial [Dehalococcoidia bacterium]|nr:hypothetical protein [Dehalococcoidia bacterium]